VLEFAISAVHGVWIDGDLRDYFSNRRKPVTTAKSIGFHCEANLFDELTIRGDTGSRVQAKVDTRGNLAHVLVH
jgi:hypothetical protein